MNKQCVQKFVDLLRCLLSPLYVDQSWTPLACWTTTLFGLLCNNACHLLLTSNEHGITFEETLKKQKEVKILTFWLLKSVGLDSWTPWFFVKVWFTTPRCSPIANCLTWERENEEKLTLNISQAEPVAADSTAYNQFLFILTLSRDQLGCTWGSWIKVFPKFMVSKSL